MKCYARAGQWRDRLSSQYFNVKTISAQRQNNALNYTGSVLFPMTARPTIA
ncbi:hypothetical protein PN441_17250 [Spirulina major CS-329]|uniref:hypothetical protein n=1 Tax=Spirulina sp. TaxID=1157 RepID=UPI003F72C436|nr:hypothetical protein [Spirulina major CS-329]